MSSDSSGNNTNKRQRTDEIKDARVIVNVGGKLFSTFRSTLTMKSTYFEKRLSGRFSDDAGDSEIIVDRDYEPFSIILSYLRSGELLISPDNLLFSSVLIEADFYGIDELVDMVKDKCYCNLNHIDYDEECSDMRTGDYTKEFPSYKHIINHTFFPPMYFDKVNYYRVISAQVLTDNKCVRLRKLDGTVVYMEVWQSVTYECRQSRAILVEPLLCLIKPAPSWVSMKSPTDCKDNIEPRFDRQLVPVSFWLGFHEDVYDGSWYTATKTVFEPKEGAMQYTVKIDNKPITMNADVFIAYTIISTDYVNETKVYSYAANGTLIEVKKFSNFMHMGPKTDADIALAAAPTTPAAPPAAIP